MVVLGGGEGDAEGSGLPAVGRCPLQVARRAGDGGQVAGSGRGSRFVGSDEPLQLRTAGRQLPSHPPLLPEGGRAASRV